ncbi:MAG TPA: hypothetical protein VJ866_04745 [Pyrinomonadaceae bacterium]|nr:hypothetical protein [Pyrinomonadaceae bacterium]
MSKSAYESKAAATTLDWPTTSDPIPHGANVVIGFHGLMCFCHRHSHRDKNCEVGIHNNSPDHDLSIKVYKVLSTFDPPYDMNAGITSQTQPDAGPFSKGQTGSLKGNMVTFKVDSPSISGVKYFQSGPGPRDHPNNFKHILDLEHDFYPGFVLQKQGDHMGPRIRINHGLFYTICPSATQFGRQEAGIPGTTAPIGSLARMVGANIYLKPDGKVTLKMPAAGDVVMKATEGKFFVLVDNGCIGCKDNDFHLYYQTFFKPTGEPTFDVVKTASGMATPAPGSPCGLIEQIVAGKGTDDTPCGAAGFGGSGEL